MRKSQKDIKESSGQRGGKVGEKCLCFNFVSLGRERVPLRIAWEGGRLHDSSLQTQGRGNTTWKRGHVVDK